MIDEGMVIQVARLLRRRRESSHVPISEQVHYEINFEAIGDELMLEEINRLCAQFIEMTREAEAAKAAKEGSDD